MKLMECPDCTHRISATALLCPVCGWAAPIEEVTPDSSSITERIGKAGEWLAGAVVVAALGPAAIAGAVGSLLIPSGVNIKGIRKKAKEIGAIDGFRLSDDEMILVTDKSLWTLDGRGADREIPFEELTKVEIDGSKIKRKTFLDNASATITLTYKCRKLFGGYYYAPNDYVNTGDSSLDIVKYADAKIREYVFNSPANQ